MISGVIKAYACFSLFVVRAMEMVESLMFWGLQLGRSTIMVVDGSLNVLK